MPSKRCCTSLKAARGDRRMVLLMWCMLVPIFFSTSTEVVLDKSSHLTRLHSYQMEKGQHIFKNYKRHSEGTFANDLTGHLDKMKAKDFVAWLTTTKRERCHRNLLQIATEV
ncbi:glucagon-1-like [Hippocampus zosterae]|uniref:glucagon-1-like n=1 Tax=Hippocampus zosterae TaxID=109293 RepID=UPI00223E294D|nr:glucagon-1-like [Hippocampus zosterae]